jgi:hypothetical protein
MPSPGVIQLTFSNQTQATFTVSTSTNLNLPLTNWTVVEVMTNVAQGAFRFVSPPTSDTQRFYWVHSP